jgi:NADP-dependent 3-hydroxy acid dehydrogenase YdfG
MTDLVDDKVIVLTGAGSGFGRVLATMAAERGAKVVGGDLNRDALDETGRLIDEAGGTFVGVETDVTDRGDFDALVGRAVESFGRVDVLVNNAGTMPLAFYSEHAKAAAAWDRCIDVNFKGVLNGILAVHDQMLQQGRGHVVNISSIYGNFPIAGSAVYSATKAAVNVLSEALRVESQGAIKVTVVKPTGVPATGLIDTVVDGRGIVGLVGQHAKSFGAHMRAYAAGELDDEMRDPDSISYWALEPEQVARTILYAIDQPWGVSISDLTVRASGEEYIL